jgi:hypothetical protein
MRLRLEGKRIQTEEAAIERGDDAPTKTTANLSFNSHFVLASCGSLHECILLYLCCSTLHWMRATVMGRAWGRR